MVLVQFGVVIIVGVAVVDVEVVVTRRCSK